MKPSFDLDRIAELARLEISQEERPVLLRDMAALVAFADTLGQVEQTDSEESAVPCDSLREDIPAPCTPRADLLSGAAQHTEQYFTVPKTVPQEE